MNWGIRMTAALLAMASLASNSRGDVELTSVGPIAFAPEGVLLVSDPMAATIFAIETGDTTGSPEDAQIEVGDIRNKIAGILGAPDDAVQIEDLAINPASGRAYLAVTRGSGKEAASLIFTVAPGSSEVELFELAGKSSTHTSLPNPAESAETRRGNPRMLSITDLAFIDDQVYVAGLSNEEFASNLRALPYPFTEANEGCSIEVYHGAHGQFETRSPIRTFAAFEAEEELNLLAAYTCTPLVRIPVGALKPDSKVQGTTIAELGNRNRPLDMVVYTRDGNDYALMANSDRGVMKIELANATKQQPITTRVPNGGTEGVPYQTIDELKGVMQLAGLNATHAVILVRNEDGTEDLKTIRLP